MYYKFCKQYILYILIFTKNTWYIIICMVYNIIQILKAYFYTGFSKFSMHVFIRKKFEQRIKSTINPFYFLQLGNFLYMYYIICVLLLRCFEHFLLYCRRRRTGVGSVSRLVLSHVSTWTRKGSTTTLHVSCFWQLGRCHRYLYLWRQTIAPKADLKCNSSCSSVIVKQYTIKAIILSWHEETVSASILLVQKRVQFDQK